MFEVTVEKLTSWVKYLTDCLKLCVWRQIFVSLHQNLNLMSKMRHTVIKLSFCMIILDFIKNFGQEQNVTNEF